MSQRSSTQGTHVLQMIIHQRVPTDYRFVRIIHARVWESMGRVPAHSTVNLDSTVRVGSVLIIKNLDSHALTHMSVAVSGCVCLTILRATWGCVSGISVLNLGITTHGREFIIKLGAI